MNKKLLYVILGAIVVLAIIAVLLFLAVQKQNRNGGEEISGPQAVQVREEAMVSPIASFDNTAIWFFDATGKLFRVNADGAGLVEFPLPALAGSIRSVLWSPSGSDFLAITPDAGVEIKNYYNSQEKIYVRLPSNIRSIAWLDNQRVIYVWEPSGGGVPSLVTADADGTGFVKVTDLFWPDLAVKASPDGKKALLYRSLPEGSINKVYEVDLATSQITTLVEQGKTLGAYWLPGGSRFMFTQASVTANPNVYLYDFTTRTAVDLNLATSLEKTVASSDGKTIYAAVPRPDNSGDVFVKIDLANFQQQTVFEAPTGVKASELLLLGNTLYYINATDKKLYRIVQ